MILKGEERSIFGKKLINFRKKGLTPGILYGEKLKSVPFFVNTKDFNKIYKESGKTTVVDFELIDLTQKFKTYRVLLKDIQVDPITEEILHIDLYQIPTHKITVKIPLVFVGKSEAELQGGILIKNHKELTVTGLPDKLPKDITIDISALKQIGDQIKVQDVPALKGLDIKESPSEVIIFAFMRKVEEVSAKAEAATAVSTQEGQTKEDSVKDDGSIPKDKESNDKPSPKK